MLGTGRLPYESTLCADQLNDLSYWPIFEYQQIYRSVREQYVQALPDVK